MLSCLTALVEGVKGVGMEHVGFVVFWIVGCEGCGGLNLIDGMCFWG